MNPLESVIFLHTPTETDEIGAYLFVTASLMLEFDLMDLLKEGQNTFLKLVRLKHGS